MKLSHLILSFLLVLASVSRAQLPELVVNRLNEIEGPATTASGTLFAEGAIVHEKVQFEKIYFIPAVLVRFGLGDRFEIRFGSRFHNSVRASDTKTGISRTEIGVKVQVADEDGIVPMTSVIVNLGIPALNSEEFRPDHLAPRIRVAGAHTLMESIALGYNAGFEWDGMDDSPVFMYGVLAGVSFDDEFTGHAGISGSFPPDIDASHAFTAGATYHASKDMMIDLSFGLGLTDTAPDYIVGIGIGIKI